MGGMSPLRSAMLASGAIAASVIGATFAVAQEGPPVPVSFEDPIAALSAGVPAPAPVVAVALEDNAAQRFAPDAARGERPTRLELEVAAGGADAPIDVSVAQRASFGANEDGDVNRRGSGSEVRVGRGLVQDNRGQSSERNAVYMFVASDNEALTWQPGSRNEFGGDSASLALEDRVTVGDLSAGVTYERNGVQASLAYVEREESTQVGNQSFNQDVQFAGVTVTMRR